MKTKTMVKKTELENEKFLFDYLNTYTPSGMEHLGFQVWIDEIEKIVPKDNIKVYKNNNVTAKLGVEDPKSVVILEAHVDEISWRISYISEDGMISVVRNGGSDSAIAPSKTGVIHHKNGMLNGVFGYPAIHVRERTNEKAPKVEELRFDTGYNKEELTEIGVKVGNIITFNDSPQILADRYIVGRALDNKLGGYIILQAFKRYNEYLKSNNIKPSVEVIIANCISEEVGLYGAKILAKDLVNVYGLDKIHSALVVDVTHDTSVEKTNRHKEGNIKCGLGPVIEHSAQCHYKLNEIIENIARIKEIQYQDAVGSFGNDTVSFYENGINTAIVGIPLKYMHSTVEMASIDDINAIVELFYEYLVNVQDSFHSNL